LISTRRFRNKRQETIEAFLEKHFLVCAGRDDLTSRSQKKAVTHFYADPTDPLDPRGSV